MHSHKRSIVAALAVIILVSSCKPPLDSEAPIPASTTSPAAETVNTSPSPSVAPSQAAAPTVTNRSLLEAPIVPTAFHSETDPAIIQNGADTVVSFQVTNRDVTPNLTNLEGLSDVFIGMVINANDLGRGIVSRAKAYLGHGAYCLDIGGVPLTLPLVEKDRSDRSHWYMVKNELLSANASAKFSGKIVTSFSEVKSSQQSDILTGGKTNLLTGGGSFGGSLDFSLSNLLTNHYVLFTVNQIGYSFFYEPLDQDLYAKAVDDGNSLAYIAKITMGRQMYVLLKASNSVSTSSISAALNAVMSSGTVSANFSSTYRSTLDSCQINTLIFGGDAAQAQTVAGTDALANVLLAFRNNPTNLGDAGLAVVSWQARSVKDDSLIMVANEATWMEAARLQMSIQSKRAALSYSNPKYPDVVTSATVTTNFPGKLDSTDLKANFVFNSSGMHYLNAAISQDKGSFVVAPPGRIQAELTRSNADISLDIRLEVYFKGQKVVDDQLGHLIWPRDANKNQNQSLQGWNRWPG